jgi:ABC-2 type transport system permease protein
MTAAPSVEAPAARSVEVSAARSLSVARGVAKFGLRGLLNDPPKLFPPVLVPLFFFAAFKGALSGIGNTKGFGYYDFTAFQFVFILYMAAMFVGVFTAFDIAADYESGMGRRLMAAAPKRMAIIAGYLLVGLGRCAMALVVVWAVVLATGMPVRGGALDIAAVVALAVLLYLATTLYGAGIALRFQTVAAGTLVLIPVFMVLFLTPVFVPRDQLTAWVSGIAGVNPLTATMEAGRGFLANDPVSVGLAFAAAGGLVAVFGVWAVTGMRKAEKAG